MMRTQRRNRQKMWYASPTGSKPVYKRDDDGNIVYIDDGLGEQIPVETGEYETEYTEPKVFRGAIFSQLENAIMRAWGSNGNNYAVLVVTRDAYPNIVNGTRIWLKSRVELTEDRLADSSTADYEVDGVLDEELNETSYYLKKLEGGKRVQ